VEANRSERWLELVSTVLLALATVATAWAAYQSRQWTGEQAQGYSHATATRIAENRSAALANRQVQIDVATFIQWIDAHAHQDKALADFYRARFRDEFRPAFAAWLATKPFTSPQAPPTPFAMPRYRLRASAEAQKLESDAAADSGHAKSANENADNYMLAVVLFASSLFFAGISTKMRSVRAQAGLLGLGCVLFLGTLIWALTLPVHLAT
jgi:ABC-type nickel/cobalt efflux system permease component RcnA